MVLILYTGYLFRIFTKFCVKKQGKVFFCLVTKIKTLLFNEQYKHLVEM